MSIDAEPCPLDSSAMLCPTVTCREAELRLDEDDAAVVAHCASCVSCAELRRELGAMSATMRGATDRELPDDARERLRRLLATRTRGS